MQAFGFKVCSCFHIRLLWIFAKTQMTYILNRLYILTALAEMDFNFEFPLKCLQPWKNLPGTSYFLADSGKVAGDKLLSR